MTIGQEQLMKLKVGVGARSKKLEKGRFNSIVQLQLKTPTKSFAWKIIEFAFILWLAAVLVLCLLIVVRG